MALIESANDETPIPSAIEDPEEHCGYAPRCIQISLDSTTLFVGCKDGTISVLEGFNRKERKPLRVIPKAFDPFAPSKKGVRALCDLDGTHLLVGRDDGQLEIVNWSDPDADLSHSIKLVHGDQAIQHDHREASNTGTGPITFIDWLDKDRLLVSFRYKGTYIGEWTGKKPTEIHSTQVLEEAKGLCCAVPIRKHDGWIFVSHSSTISGWIKQAGEVERDHLAAWPEGEKPGFVTDYALIKPPDEDREADASISYAGSPGDGVYISTDNGVYLLQWPSSKESVIQPLRVALPDIGGMCMAISHYASAGYQFLWVSDFVGDAHLFWDDPAGNSPPNWRRSGIRHDESQVILAIAAWHAADQDLVVGQARRNDRIVVSRYMLEEQSGQGGAKKLGMILRSPYDPSSIQEYLGTPASSLRDRKSPKETNEDEIWSRIPNVANLFEKAGEKPSHRKVLLEFLGRPTPNLAKSLLRHLNRDDRFEQAVHVWTHALLGTVHRQVRATRAIYYLGIIRWLRVTATSFSEEPITDRKLQAFEDSIRNARKWGLFGSTYAERSSAIRPLAALMKRPEHYKLLDRLVYAGRLFFDRVDLESTFTERHAPGQTAWHVAAIEPGGQGNGHQTTVAVSWISGDIDVFNIEIKKWPDLAGSSLSPQIWIHPRDQSAPEGQDPTAEDVQEGFPLEAENINSHLRSRDSRYSDNLDSAEQKPKNRRTPNHSHCRSLLLGHVMLEKRQRKYFLLCAPAPTKEVPEKFGLWWLTNDTNGIHVEKEGLPDATIPLSCHETNSGSATSKKSQRDGGSSEEVSHHDNSSTESADRESVYSLLQLEPGLVLAGLRGVGGNPQVVALRIGFVDGKTELSCFKSKKEALTGLSPETKAGARNRVWSLAKAESQSHTSEEKEERHICFAGCGDGQVLQLQVPSVDRIEDEFELNPSLVERLGAPVWALACRELQDGRARVFAGGADGTLVAWQEPETRTAEKGQRSPTFNTLWATWENDRPIARIHPFLHREQAASDQQEKSVTEIPMVLAVTHQGTAVLIDDRDMVEMPASRREHKRIALPGARHGRVRLKSSVFASALLNIRDQTTDVPTVTRLVSASGDGRVMLHTLHFPLYLTQRKAMHRELMNDWLKLLRDTSDKEPLRKEEPASSEGTPECSKLTLAPTRLRLLECTVSAAHSLSLTPIRWLLDTSNSGWPLPSIEYRDWLPRHLQSLIQLPIRWNRSYLPEESDQKITALATSLRRARNLRDPHLFGEIISVMLRQANKQFFELLTHGQVDSVAWEARRDLYKRVLHTMDTAIRSWLGTEEEERLVIVFVKNLLDGDALWQLSRKGGVGSPLNEILQRRTYYLRQLLVSGKSLIALETLRAANLAFLRACTRLEVDRPHTWVPEINTETPKFELPWRGVNLYLRALSDFASRITHSSSGVSHAFKQEIFRAYALGLCACPSASVRIAHWISEANLIHTSDTAEGLKNSILRQCRVLREIGCPVPRISRRLFAGAMSDQYDQGLFLWSKKAEHKGQPHETLWNELSEDPQPDLAAELAAELTATSREERVRYLAGPRRLFERLKPVLGIENARAVAGLNVAYELVNTIHAIAENLQSTARSINIESIANFEQWFKGQSRIREFYDESSSTYLFRHSGEFWQRCLRNLEKRICDFPQRKYLRSELNIRPSTLLFHRPLMSWCEESLALLEHQLVNVRIFEPQYTLYRNALEHLKRAAEDFPRCAAVQKNIVTGVLRHGLLGSLDEHVLELEEIAQALDPIMVWDYWNNERSIDSVTSSSPAEGSVQSNQLPDSTAERFASYLLRRSRNAESIPKNLRVLLGLLSEVRFRDPQEHDSTITIDKDLLEDFVQELPSREKPGWHPIYPRKEGKTPIVTLSPVELQYLKLVLSELDQNDRVHGLPLESRISARNNSSTGGWPTVDLQLPSCLTLRFHYKPDTNYEKRLERLVETGLQEPIAPRSDRTVASNGTGLYLASFAASVVGWKLEVSLSLENDNILEFRLGKFEPQAEGSE